MSRTNCKGRWEKVESGDQYLVSSTFYCSQKVRRSDCLSINQYLAAGHWCQAVPIITWQLVNFVSVKQLLFLVAEYWF